MIVTYYEFVFYSVSLALSIVFLVNMAYIVNADASTKNTKIDYLVHALWALVLIFGACVISYLFGWVEFNTITNKNSHIISAIGISLSALLASATIMKSINNTNEIESKKEARELFDKKIKVYHEIRKVQSLMIGKSLNLDQTEKFVEETKISEFILKNKRVINELETLHQEVRLYLAMEGELAQKREELLTENPYEARQEVLNIQVAEMPREINEKFQDILPRLNVCAELIKKEISIN